MNPDETIFALATAPGKGGVAVFRISGKNAYHVLTRLCGMGFAPEPRVATLCKIQNPNTGELIDHALVLWFPAPHSFSGEDVVELQTHGGRAISHAVSDALCALPGFRLAEPGEFTRRAFENDKMDLTQAESIADLVDAETEAQRKQALRQMSGELGQLYESWRARLMRILAYCEAAIDFSDEEIPQDLVDQQTKDIILLVTEITKHLDDRHRGERLRDGFSIAILGAPNAGKSSLLNALARRDVAIVSSLAGTTRDVIEVHLDLGGYSVVVADTAGLRKSDDVIESEGVRRALERAAHADLKLTIFDGTAWPAIDQNTCALIDGSTIAILNKMDLVAKAGINMGELEIEGPNSQPLIPISAQTGEGIPELLRHVVAEIEQRFESESTPPLTRRRHRSALETCLQHLKRSLSVSVLELKAEDTRMAMRALGQITGRVDVEDLLDVIFRDFCIGK